MARLVADTPPPMLSELDFWLLGGTLAANLWVAWYEARKGR